MQSARGRTATRAASVIVQEPATMRRMGCQSARPDGTQTVEVVGTFPSLICVVVAGLDLRDYLPDVPAGAGPQDLTSDAFVQLVAPYLREELIDPWRGRGKSRVAPVMAMEAGVGLCFVKAAACLN